jgi:predicted RNA-binding Zn ribbon-like protein
MEPGTTSAAGMTRSWVLPDEPVPVRLMNTIWADRTGAHDDLTTQDDLSAWLQSLSAADQPPPVTRRQLAAARQLRDALRRLAAFVTADTRPAAASIIAKVDVAIETVNRAATATPPAPRLTRHGELLRTTTAADRPTIATALAAIAIAAIDLFASDTTTALRACHAPGCVLYFVKDHPRREWCSNTCGNRARAARHYRRHRSDRAPGGASR